jgi:hypothetical protein
VKQLRAVVVAVAAVLLGGGYLASQWAHLASLSPESRDATAKYVAALDSSLVPYLALLVLAACVAFAAAPQEAEGA